MQHIAAKCITGLQSKSCTDRLKIFCLNLLQTRSFIFDMVEVVRILQNDTSNCRLFELSKSGHKTRAIKCSRILWIEPALINCRIFSNRKNPKIISRGSKNQQVKVNNLAQPTRSITTGPTCRSTNLQLVNS